MKPAVYIYERIADPAALAQICAGLEEEGIPFAIFQREEDDLKILAYNAANNSRLHVGIGISGNIAVMQIKNCQEDKPVFTIGPSASFTDYRKLGTNAARTVKRSRFV
ncbi:MAG: glycerol dehydratase reactivase beta/small subunit family protein [Defluviitaleaceae bacterium]|nr:glycerol dehydratase reactivase beta/small subunit family protein [Defluviitaleaceae bacterium]